MYASCRETSVMYEATGESRKVGAAEFLRFALASQLNISTDVSAPLSTSYALVAGNGNLSGTSLAKVLLRLCR
jgi:hypothetical protein